MSMWTRKSATTKRLDRILAEHDERKARQREDRLIESWLTKEGKELMAQRARGPSRIKPM